ncbi:MAG: hypothetical protein ACKOPP_03505, partial [Bacteroidota bacterium]
MSVNQNPALPQPDPNLPNGEQEMPGLHPMVYVFKLLYFWPYLIMALVAGLAGAFVYNKYAEPVYKVNSSLMITENKSALVLGYHQRGVDLVHRLGVFV